MALLRQLSRANTLAFVALPSPLLSGQAVLRPLMGGGSALDSVVAGSTPFPDPSAAEAAAFLFVPERYELVIFGPVILGRLTDWILAHPEDRLSPFCLTAAQNRGMRDLMTFDTQDTSYPGSPKDRRTMGSNQPVTQPLVSRVDRQRGHSLRSGCASTLQGLDGGHFLLIYYFFTFSTHSLWVSPE